MCVVISDLTNLNLLKYVSAKMNSVTLMVFPGERMQRHGTEQDREGEGGRENGRGGGKEEEDRDGRRRERDRDKDREREREREISMLPLKLTTPQLIGPLQAKIE